MIASRLPPHCAATATTQLQHIPHVRTTTYRSKRWHNLNNQHQLYQQQTENRLKWPAVPVTAGQHPFKTKVYGAFYPIAPALAVEQTPATRKEKNALK